MLRAENAAKSLCSISSNSSAYIRLAHPAHRLPPYLHIQARSDWYNTAMSCMALESFTLPSRVRGNHGSRRAVFSDFEAILNAEGNQNIFELSFSILSRAKPASQTNGTLNGHSFANGTSKHEDEAPEATELDIDLTPCSSSSSRPTHVQNFGQVLVSRGPENDPEITKMLYEPQRRGYGSSTNFERYLYLLLLLS